jgi:membrane-bound serine protease (ClpP class)
MKRCTLILCSILISSLFLKANAKTNTSYAEISLKGTVNPIVAEYIVSSIEKAEKSQSQFIILTVDTPGGLMTSMRDIIKAIFSAKIPVIVYTYPKGAQAASAGGFIMLAGHLNAMSPGTEIGAMHPVSPFINFSDADQKKDTNKNVMGMKVLNDTIAYGKSIAQKRNRNVRWTKQAIEDAISSTYKEAKAQNVIDYIAEDIEDLLRQVDGKRLALNGKTITLHTKHVVRQVYDMTGKEEFMNFFADPQIVFFLFIIAIVGIAMEFKNPGMIVPGTIGGVSFLLFLMAIRILPINIVGLGLVVLAIVLFVLEINITSYGLLTLGGVVSFMLGSLILFDSPLPGFSIPISSVIVTLLCILALFYFVVKSVIESHRGRVVSGSQGLLGEKGNALTEFINRDAMYHGKVMIHGEIWNARSEEIIMKGDPVQVIEADGMWVLVKKII